MYGEAFLKTCKEYVPMGVEERAEKYALNSVCETCYDCPFTSKGNSGCDKYRSAKQDYIAIAKENGIVWHKVADGDLPKDEDLEMQILCWTCEGYQLLSLFSDPKPIFDHYKVIAWCEIPRYKGV